MTSPSPTKPRSKRAKISGDKDETNNIELKAASGHYKGIQDFLDDVEKASSCLIDRLPSGESNTALVARIAAFKRRMNTLLLQTSLLKKSVIKAEPSDDAATSAESPAPTKGEREDKVVLTLFGNPSNPKHLFSSLQRPLKVPLSSAPGKERYVDLNAQLRESALPNGITTTKVTPFNVETQPETSRTLGEVFAPPTTLQQLEPPRKMRSWPRNSSSLWIDPFEAITNIKTIPGEKNNYGFASLPAGQWLQYGGATSSPSYWSRKQKQHGQNNEDVNSAEKPEETFVSPEDVSDLVQGAYSSFAPSFDSSGAIVQSHSKNLVWYAKRGARRFRTLVSLYNAAARQELSALQEASTNLDESSLEDAVKTFEPDSLPEEKPKSDEETESKDLEEVLREVSELLETLNSYNQIRSLDPLSTSLPNPESKESATDVSAPDAPSAAEKEIYETLRSSLAAIIATLPPYAVAKLNGEQLADLNISQKVVIKNTDYHGTMEPDDYTTQQMRLAAAAPATAGASRTSTPHIAPSSRSGSYQAPQAAYNQRVYPPNARVPPPAGGYQAGQQYFAGRQPSTSGPYTPGATPQTYAGARPPVPAAGRPGYVQPYSQPAAALQQFQRAGPNGFGPYSAPQGTSPAQGSPQPYAARSGQPGAYNASFSAGRSSSPQKPPAYATPQPRTPYANATSSNPQQRYHAQQQPPHYGAYPPNQASPPATYSSSATPVNYARSAAEQAAVMDRNKAQIAANQQRQNSGTPQPPAPQQRPQSSQSSSQERSVTPGSKPNGTPTPAGTSQ